MLPNIFGWYLLLGLGVMRRDQITITYELFLLHQLRYGLSCRNMSQTYSIHLNNDAEASYKQKEKSGSYMST